jgi:lysophospholipase L1-like esterase
MNRSLWYVGLLFLIGLGTTAAPALAAIPPGYVPTGPGDIYLTLGDSLALGVEEPTNDDGEPGYPDTVHTTLFAVYSELTTYTNYGQANATSSTLLETGGQIEQAEAYIAEERAAGRTVGLVTLNIGGNDLISILPSPWGSGADPETVLANFEANLDTSIQRLVTALTVNEIRQGDLLLMDAYNPYPGLTNPLTGEALADTWIPQFNAIIRSTAAKYNVPMAEVAAAFAGNEPELLYVQRPYAPLFPSPDPAAYDFHPRPLGHCVIARELLAVSSYAAQPLTCGAPEVYLPLISVN